MPMKFSGRGKGPEVMFLFSEVNVGELFINSNHQYEVSVCCTIIV